MVDFLLPVLLLAGLTKIFFTPVKWTLRAALHCGGGLLCLWILNLASGVTGIVLPVNGVTVLLAGALGLPGIGLVVLLELVSG